MAQLFPQKDGAKRISVNRTEVKGWDSRGGPIWEDGISWDELMEIKQQIGFSGMYAVEIYPSNTDTVNTANIRHLWVIDEPPAFAWRRKDDH